MTLLRLSSVLMMPSPFSPYWVKATPKKMEKTTICSISLVARASNKLLGNKCSMKCCTEKLWVLPITSLAAEVSNPFTLSFNSAPGAKKLTNINPSSKEAKEALKNQSIDLPPTRPTAFKLPILAMPTMRVVMTNGAIII